jgi:predicted phosphodiesterase
MPRWAPVHAVCGNNDGPDIIAWGAAETLTLDLEGLRVAMIHDSGTAAGRAAPMRRRFTTADLVVFGHSHIPLDATADGIRISILAHRPTDAASPTAPSGYSISTMANSTR